tara:strand:- start:2135 stop:2491 length:357 start_codon:yes stop_codon:yes gene_type:complete
MNTNLTNTPFASILSMIDQTTLPTNRSTDELTNPTTFHLNPLWTGKGAFNLDLGFNDDPETNPLEYHPVYQTMNSPWFNKEVPAEILMSQEEEDAYWDARTKARKQARKQQRRLTTAA